MLASSSQQGSPSKQTVEASATATTEAARHTSGSGWNLWNWGGGTGVSSLSPTGGHLITTNTGVTVPETAGIYLSELEAQQQTDPETVDKYLRVRKTKRSDNEHNEANG